MMRWLLLSFSDKNMYVCLDSYSATTTQLCSCQIWDKLDLHPNYNWKLQQHNIYTIFFFSFLFYINSYKEVLDSDVLHVQV